MRPPFSYAPALPAAAGITVGIVLYSIGTMYIGLCASIAVFLGLTLIGKQYLSYFALFTACGIMVTAAHPQNDVPEDAYTGKHMVQCRILHSIERPLSTAYVVEIQKLDSMHIAPFKARVISGSVENIMHEGCTVQFKATFRNPHTPADIPYETDYNKYLQTEGIASTGTIISGIEMLSPPDTYHHMVGRARARIYNAIVDSPISPAAASFLVAAISGDKSLLTDDDFRHFRSTGVAHILALSGLHVGIIAMLISLMLFPLNLCSRRKIPQGVIVVSLIWIYAIIAGMQPSIVRASVMITVVVLSGYLQRGYYVFNSLFLSIIILLVFNPYWLFTPGFQLSVAAVASLLMFGNTIPAKLKKRPLVYFILNLAVMPIAAMMGTGIVSAYYFGTFPLMFVFGNIIVGLLFPWLLGGGVVLSIFTCAGINFKILGLTVDSLYRLMTLSLTALGEFGVEITTLFFSPWIIMPYAAALIFLAFAIREHRSYQWLMCASMLLVCVIVNSCDRDTIPTAEFYIPRNAQHTRIIMRSGNIAHLYTDTEPAENEVNECDNRYRRFLLSRNCSGHFVTAKEGWHTEHFAVGADYIQACGKLIMLIRGNNWVNDKARNRHADYGLITNAYTGSISSIKKAGICDTLLLGQDLHPARRARMIRECADTIPYRDIKSGGFKIIL